MIIAAVSHLYLSFTDLVFGVEPVLIEHVCLRFITFLKGLCYFSSV